MGQFHQAIVEQKRLDDNRVGVRGQRELSATGLSGIAFGDDRRRRFGERTSRAKAVSRCACHRSPTHPLAQWLYWTDVPAEGSLIDQRRHLGGWIDVDQRGGDADLVDDFRVIGNYTPTF